MRADFPDTCTLCHGPIRSGDTIVHARDGWAHKGCGERE